MLVVELAGLEWTMRDGRGGAGQVGPVGVRMNWQDGGWGRVIKKILGIGWNAASEVFFAQDNLVLFTNFNGRFLTVSEGKIWLNRVDPSTD